MTGGTLRGLGNRPLVASVAIVVILALALFVAVYRSPPAGQSSQSSSAQSVGSSGSVTSSVETGQDTIVLHFFGPCNCSYDLNWAWPTYNTLAALKSASYFVVVAQVTSARTVGKNTSDFSPSASPKTLIPVTDYAINVTTVLSGGPSLEAGETLYLGQVGGTANGTTMSVAGYPTLSVGGSYVFFLTSSESLLGCTNELFDLIQTSVTTGGPQGLFSIQGGNVYSLDNAYPQADAWLPMKADGVPLAQFVQEVQAAIPPVVTPQSATNSTSSGETLTTTIGCS